MAIHLKKLIIVPGALAIVGGASTLSLGLANAATDETSGSDASASTTAVDASSADGTVTTAVADTSLDDAATVETAATSTDDSSTTATDDSSNSSTSQSDARADGKDCDHDQSQQ